MKIVVSSKSYYPLLGGSIVFAAMMAKAFAQSHHEVVVITRTAGDPIEETEYSLIRQPSWTEKNRLADWADVVLQIDASWRDIIPFLLRNVLWVPTVHRGKAPYRDLQIKDSAKLFAEHIGYKVGKTIGVAEYVVKSWKLSNSAIPNPYDDGIFYPPDNSSSRDIDILFVGRITEDKGVFKLLEALSGMSTGNRKHTIAFVGSGPAENELKLRAKELETRFHFHFPGMASSETVAGWMRRSRVLAFPTTPDWLEASPLTPLEATACGCKVVASDIGGTRENVSPSHWMVRSGDAHDLRQGLTSALEAPVSPIDPVTLDFLRSRALKKIASSYIDHFESALAAKRI